VVSLGTTARPSSPETGTRSRRASSSRRMPSSCCEDMVTRESILPCRITRSTTKTPSTRSCVFYGDLYPNQQYDKGTSDGLRLLIEARRRFAYGHTVDYFEDRNCIGFVRMGDGDHPGCVVVISNKSASQRCVVMSQSFPDCCRTDSPGSESNFRHVIRMNVENVRLRIFHYRWVFSLTSVTGEHDIPELHE
jgi:hypothetical protein